MNKTKIDWADMTWNPVTGCLHGCDYCYARKIAKRFGNRYLPFGVGINVLDKKADGDPYPYGFEPTFHKYRLGEPARKTKPQNIFVCSMADLFGDWVPDEWIQAVFDACEAAPQHRYLFLTKNPGRYEKLWSKGLLPRSHWYGHTITDKVIAAQAKTWSPAGFNNFVSIEPILGDAAQGNWLHLYKWVIVGAETGNRKDKVIPEKQWIDNIVNKCFRFDVPIFMKESLRTLMGADFKQEFPWGVKA